MTDTPTEAAIGDKAARELLASELKMLDSANKILHSLIFRLTKGKHETTN